MDRDSLCVGAPVWVLYHADCVDGFSAAWVCWRWFCKTKGLEDVKFAACRYGEGLPEVPDGCVVVMVDFSASAKVLEDLNGRSEAVLVLDHHKSAAAELSGLPYARFDMEKCGAVLAWEFFFPELDVPEFLLFVQDRDLWRWELPWSREFSMGLRLYDFDFGLWEELMSSAKAREEVIREGTPLLEYMWRECQAKAKKAEKVMWDGRPGRMLNATQWISETCEAMLMHWEDAEFACCWFERGGKKIYSLRSRKGSGVDVSVMAHRRGGGGHENAAGFSIEMGCFGAKNWGAATEDDED